MGKPAMAQTAVPKGAVLEQRTTTREQAYINRQIHAELLDLDKHIGWEDSVVLKELRITQIETGWRLMIKGNRKGKPLAAFIWADTFAAALDLAGCFAATGILEWKVDKYPPRS